MARPKDDVVEAAADAFFAAIRDLRSLQLERHGAPGLLPVDVTMAQLKAVLALVATPGLTGKDLAARLGVAPSAVTPLVDKLVGLELAVREPDPRDRRVTWIRPTPRAIQVRDGMMSAGRAVLVEVLEGLTAKDLAALERGLTLVAERAAAKLERGGLFSAPAEEQA